MNCCDTHADALPDGCNQGRKCPERCKKEPAKRESARVVTQNGGATVDEGIVLLDEPDSWDRIWSVIGWGCAVLAAGFLIGFVLYSAWLPWPHMVAALSF